MPRVLLLSMPFGALDRQALGPSLLKPILREDGIDCELRYLTFPFAELIGVEDYCWFTTAAPHTALAGEWTFTGTLYGEQATRAQAYLQDILQGTWRLDTVAVRRILRARALAEPFLEHCMATVRWRRHDVVGFTSTFEQNIASLALACRIKARFPSIAVVFGGGNWEDSMGVELHRRFAFVDYACIGEAEESFPALVRALTWGRAGARQRIAGLVYRSGPRSVSTGPPRPVAPLDRFPPPDYRDYFRDLERSSAAASIVPTLLIESGRGCWWGAKSHCTFCGLNGSQRSYRAKSAGRVLREIDVLLRRYTIDLVQAVDNILGMQFFTDLLPALATFKRPVNLFYEIKANLTRSQVRQLRAAGIRRVQPGIESLSDHVLRLMRKGVTALQNVQLLKWCREDGVTADWNLLYGFPGERPEDYQQMLRLLPAIRFLGPPTACGPVRLDRFSPYFHAPGAYGLINVRPLRSYQYIYPFDHRSLLQLAYYFDYDYTPEVDPRGFAAPVVEYVHRWQADPERGTLHAVEAPGGALALVDTRSDACGRHTVLQGRDRAAYEFCDTVRPWTAVAAHIRAASPGEGVSDGRVRGLLDALVARRLMVREGDRYLSFALRTGPLAQRLPTQDHAKEHQPFPS